MIEEYIKNNWYCVVNQDSQNIPSIRESIKGKYLFFSKSCLNLVQLAKTEILYHNFHVSKCSTPSNKIGDDFVLCLYWSDEYRLEELRQRYENNNIISFAGWKNDRETYAKEYSQHFIESLTPEQKIKFNIKSIKD